MSTRETHDLTFSKFEGGQESHLPKKPQNVKRAPWGEKKEQKIHQVSRKEPCAQTQAGLGVQRACECQKPKEDESGRKLLKTPEGHNPEGSHRSTRVDAPGQNQRCSAESYIPNAFQRQRCPRVRQMRRYARQGQRANLPKKLKNGSSGLWEEKKTQKIHQKSRSTRLEMQKA